ncbi:helix-turn-helix domain-containing protein [Streptomyces sp. S3(2020)]|uniref:helix-turn-helix domain-containing protein n=1 Tax=Streptomyces sp. S3(2020) TaxID=2732044 RepID=UPI0014880575|nr:helix-turn-helix domain-containing protein [Streptomyces sp. S3(2020)]
MTNGTVPPRLLDVVTYVHEAAGEFRASVLVEAGSGTEFDVPGSVSGSSAATEKLSVQEAARLSGLSDTYWRRLARRGDVEASRSGRKGEWVLDGGSVAAWVAERGEKKAG